MASLSRSAFRDLLRGLSREEFERFVADLWRARGWDVADAENGIVAVVHPDSGERRRLLVRHDAPRFVAASVAPAGVGVDVVVRSGIGESGDVADADVVDADDLYGMVLYAIDRDTCESLFEAHFDRPPTEADDAPAAPAGVVTGRHVPRRYLVVAAALVLVVAAIGASAGVHTSGANETATANDAGTTPTERDDFSEADARRYDSTSSPPRTTSRTVGAPFPPGLSASGITNATALADAHVEALSLNAYRMVLVHREFANGEPTGYRREVVDVERLTKYRSAVSGAGTVRTNPLVVDEEEVYANGSVQFVRRESGDGVEYTAHPLGPRIGRDPFLLRSEAYVRWFLSVDDSRVVDVVERDGRTYFWVTFEGDPWPGARNTTGSALVSSSGVVQTIRRRYTPSTNPNTTVEVTVRITDVGDADVTPPPWATEAARATAGKKRVPVSRA